MSGLLLFALLIFVLFVVSPLFGAHFIDIYFKDNPPSTQDETDH